MKSSYSSALYYKLLTRIVAMDVKGYFTHKQTKKSLRKLLASAIIGCEYDVRSAIETNTLTPNDVKFHLSMDIGLQKLLPYPIGQKTPCGIRVGACAENVASNEVLLKLEAHNQ